MFKGIQKRFDGCGKYVILLVSLIMCCCELWEGEKIFR
jgi:hypothetical protein